MGNYFKGNTRARRLRISKIQKKIYAKRMKRHMKTFAGMFKK